jgi:predicted ABC-type ATPase
MIQQKRLRIFAGPNGSGKSTMINIVRDYGVDMGVYVNADEIKKEFQHHQCLDFDSFGITLHDKALTEAFKSSSFFTNLNYKDIADTVYVEHNKLYTIDSFYYDIISTFIADYIRNKLLINGSKFTFETVMSHPSKIEFINKAVAYGYKTYLYFVSLENPELNKERVKARVQLNGHDVPPEKIESRYYRTMELLFDAIKAVDKAYFFDNSGAKSLFFAKYEHSEIRFENGQPVPQWFYTYVINKINSNVLEG